jgi:hypothetical protein
MHYLKFIPLVFSVMCFGAEFLIGSEVDESGILHEPFALLPLGYVFGIIGVVWLIISGIFSK